MRRGKALEAAAILTKLFWSERAFWTIDIAPILESEILDTRNRQSIMFQMDILSAFDVVAEQVQRHLMESKLHSNPMCLCLIQEVGPGSSKIALPVGVGNHGIWSCVDCDGNLRNCQVGAISQIEELSTVWANMETAWPVTKLEFKWIGLEKLTFICSWVIFCLCRPLTQGHPNIWFARGLLSNGRR